MGGQPQGGGQANDASANDDDIVSVALLRDQIIVSNSRRPLVRISRRASSAWRRSSRDRAAPTLTGAPSRSV
ncbi:hypothetical protein USDA257_c19300 [Sinorhizobium fredii USDA 257]|uniref:Uncharacterized protein n=1 Tax=Sinorhizobium fredii (strain USDA 257) TaxID=1185652 RepID=I3X3R0_SINF2|nr:hypothetical protein USDA257_c19300 [Sinorhizobium fredii USDA 257]